MKSPQKQSLPAVQHDTPQAIGFESMTNYPVEPASSPIAVYGAVQRYAAGGGDAVVQLKSRFTQRQVDATAKPPIIELSEQVGPIFSAAGIAEQYVFHGDVIKKPSEYAGDYKKAIKATAIIEQASFGKNGERANDVITPYGHFGLMERSILGRTNYGNLFDGGHLIERSLMENADADCHGNLAPQEGKGFNQDLMRGWEHIPEEYQKMMDFIYSMELTYNGSTYQRTGKQLIESGVVPNALLEYLKTQGKDGAFLAHNFTFSRWIPYQWKGDLDTGSAATFPSKAFNMGAHYQKLKPTEEDAHRRVLTHDPAIATLPALVRTKSGMISGAISGLAAIGADKFTVGNNSKISSVMYSGVPEPSEIQSKGDREEKEVMSVFPASGSVNVLAGPFYLSNMLAHLLKVPTKQKRNPIRNLDSKGVAQKAFQNPEFSILYQKLRDPERAARFVIGLQLRFAGVPSPKLTKADLIDLAGRHFDERTKLFVTLITYDPQCLEDGPVAVPASVSVPLLASAAGDADAVTASAMDVEDEEE
jgi:hypothetical protein